MALNIFVAAMYRAGSMHIARGLASLLGYRSISLTGQHGEGDDEQNINCFSAAILLPYGGNVIHQHCPASSGNLGLMAGFHLRPLVVVRSLPDTLVSLKERIDDCVQTGAVIPGLHIPAMWAKMYESQKYEWTIHNAAPWQMKFYVGWLEQRAVEVFWVKYEDFYADQRAGFGRICDWYGKRAGGEAFMHQITESNINLSVGQVGRGRKLIPPGLLDVLERQVASWGVSVPGWLTG